MDSEYFFEAELYFHAKTIMSRVHFQKMVNLERVAEIRVIGSFLTRFYGSHTVRMGETRVTNRAAKDKL
jgi:hypothetical protein